ncbi:S-layer homology domain-containing protein [Alteribacillus persepolensis]|uniref:S-layer homology domain-containing protein n=1 Tax=Alteribacillus persepolensis TaxID=568899 RepID=A0A1G8AZN6_9BACI|nr:PepSY1/2 domain-containing protein [Alteribacillus persepolensis]SDH26361.1 S-layer homology domain-containing protein [Alteribacillus persepolensis]
MRHRYVGLLSLSSALALGVTSAASAQDMQHQMEENNAVQEVEISAADVEVQKSDLIQRLHELFPDKFDFLSEQDFRMNNHHIIGVDDDVVRHSLHFNKQVGNDHINGTVEFIGDDLQLHNFHYQPEDTAGALYPPDVTQEEAQQKATDFVERMTDGDYQQSERQHPQISWGNRTLTEPVEYQFYFQRLEDGVPVQNQEARVTVLGNGEITQYYAGQPVQDSASYEPQDNVLDKQQVIEAIEENINVELQYAVEHEPGQEEPEVKLVYGPQPAIQSVHAVNGTWEINQAFIEELPEAPEVTMLKDGDTPDEETGEPISADEAKTLVEELFVVPEGEGELHLESVQERNYNDTDVYSIHYMIRQEHSGYGSSVDIDKQTGEIINFHNSAIRNGTPEENLNHEEALEKAVQALEQHAPSAMHNHAYPLYEGGENVNEGIYHFQFPQVKNGLIVNGSSLSVAISAEDGSLVSLRQNPLSITEWPAKDEAVDKETALNDYVKDLDVSLSYVNHPQSEDSDHHYLVYHPEWQGIYYDAIRGEWQERTSADEPESEPVYTEHWAADELNYLIDAGILSVSENPPHPNDAVTNGEGLEMVMKSLTRFYDHPAPVEEEKTQTFNNIGPDHELYQVVERAAQQQIVDTDNASFPMDESLTRQQLAYWYIRALGLEEAAKHSDIYRVPFSDADEIEDAYKGYVALSKELGIFEGDDNNAFNPESEVTLAQLAVTSFRLAENASEIGGVIR